METIIQNNQVIQVLDYLFQKFGIAVDWSQQNIMPYMQELCEKYIRWKISTSIAWIVISTILLAGGIICAVCGKRIWDEFDGFWGGIMIAMGTMLALSGFMVVGIQIFNIIRCNIFPELQLMQYVQSLMNNG